MRSRTDCEQRPCSFPGRQTRGGCRLNPAHEKQYDEDDHDDADDTDAPVTVAIAVAAETAAKPTEQEDNQDDDEDESDRRGVVLSGTYDGMSAAGPSCCHWRVSIGRWDRNDFRFGCPALLA